MTSLSSLNDHKPRRHDLIFVSPEAWRSVLQTRDDLAGESLIAGWVDCGWPLITRRPLPDEADGLPLGLPLPPSVGKRRLSVLMRTDDIVSTAPPLSLSAAVSAAPRTWLHTLDKVERLASQHGVEARVYGSLAWHKLTGLEYLTASSDLDLLLPLPRSDLARFTADLAAIEAAAPMRLDGELVRADGAAVNWREIHAGAPDVLVKSTSAVVLLDTDSFLDSRIFA